MILSGHQPVYFPGIIFFNKMALSDFFMYVGHVQFTQKSWQQRNKIRLGLKEYLLSVPVIKSKRFGQSIDDVKIDGNAWKRKHLGTIKQAYRAKPFFDQYFPELEQTIAVDYETLGELNRATVSLLRKWLQISTPILESYDFPTIKSSKTKMLIEMCNAVGSDCYLSNEGSRVYVDESLMAEHGIQHCWQNFVHPIYNQGNDIFIPNMSAIDLVFSVGPGASIMVRNSGAISKEYLTPNQNN